MAYNSELKAGKYNAHSLRAGAKETQGGALMLGIEWQIDPGDDTITSWTCLVSKAGAVMERAFKQIRTWAPAWDGNPDWFSEHPTEFDVVLTIERRVYNGVERPEVVYIDPIGGGIHGIPEDDQKALKDKFGARLRAFASTLPKPVETAKKTPPPPAASQPSPAQPPVSIDDVWEIFSDKYAGPKDEVNTAWREFLTESVGRTDYKTFTQEELQELKKAANDYLPF